VGSRAAAISLKNNQGGEQIWPLRLPTRPSSGGGEAEDQKRTTHDPTGGREKAVFRTAAVPISTTRSTSQPHQIESQGPRGLLQKGEARRFCQKGSGSLIESNGIGLSCSKGGKGKRL